MTDYLYGFINLGDLVCDQKECEPEIQIHVNQNVRMYLLVFMAKSVTINYDGVKTKQKNQNQKNNNWPYAQACYSAALMCVKRQFILWLLWFFY
jgi:hypothetical protein